MKMQTLKESFLKWTVLCSILMILPYAANSQSNISNIGVEGAVWFYSQIYNPFGVPGTPYYIRPLKVSYVSDTTIQEKSCQILHLEHIEHTINSPLFLYAQSSYIYLHNESGQIYSFDPYADSFMLSIDFNAEVGDSWIAALPCGDPELIWNPEFYTGYTQFEIEQISWLETESDTLKVLHAKSSSTFSSTFIERIGMPWNFLPYPSTNCGHLGHDGQLKLCSYYDPDVGLIKFQDYDCETQIIVTSTGDVVETEFALSPNPAHDEFFIQLPGNLIGYQSMQLAIYNQLGQRVHYQSWQYTTVSIGHLPPGMYFVHLQHEDVMFVPQKLVIH